MKKLITWLYVTYVNQNYGHFTHHGVNFTAKQQKVIWYLVKPKGLIDFTTRDYLIGSFIKALDSENGYV